MTQISRHRSRQAVAVLTCLLLLLSLPAGADLRLEPDTRQLSDDQLALTQQLLSEVDEGLPPRMRQQLDRTVQVRWSYGLPEQVMGRASRTDRILLNGRFLDQLLESGSATLPGRTHPDLYTELQAALIHELAHLYDQGRYWHPAETLQLRYCRTRFETQSSPGLPAICRGQINRRYTLSDSPRLLDLAGWPEQVGRRNLRERINRQRLRTPDPYELEDAQEFVAVNLEYFLLDPEYGCRRPGLAAFFRDHFSWEPATVLPCASSLPYLSAELNAEHAALGWLDPKRIYQVHYLLAEPDDSWAGRWGHSMLRLVICAPGRAPGPECLLDLQHHLVLSYRAFVDDLQLSSWDGLTGVYPSRLFFLPLQRVIDEYTRTELRSLTSVPLNLSPAQINDLAVHAISQHWSYDGVYYFVGNNCAVETLKLLRTGSHHAALLDLDSQTPRGLLDLLQARDLADASPLRDAEQARRMGYRFDSYRQRYQQLYETIRRALALGPTSVDQWLEMQATDRARYLSETDLRTTAALLMLEHAALRRQVQRLQHELKQRYLSDGAGDTLLNEAGDLMQQLLRGGSVLSRPADLLDSGYGLPQPADRHLLESRARQQYTSLLAMSDRIEEQLPMLFTARQRSELEGIGSNIQQLQQQLRRLHREAGGLQLP